jgi:hypothetical protein
LRNTSGFSSAAGRWRMWLRYRGIGEIGEIDLKFGADGGHF